ncbi:hypothetical protein TgHK011_009416 [Trichoderma gracile]|nr:hypothetical protein TgHK011_009416 [Trichoderma gracile]
MPRETLVGPRGLSEWTLYDETRASQRIVTCPGLQRVVGKSSPQVSSSRLPSTDCYSGYTDDSSQRGYDAISGQDDMIITGVNGGWMAWASIERCRV